MERPASPADVRHLPPVAPEQLPSFYATADVGLIPYKREPWIVENGFPLKALEMAATGLPVVATEMLPLHDVARAIRVAQDDDDFLAKLRVTQRDGLDADMQRELDDVCRRNDYDSKFAHIRDLLGQIVSPETEPHTQADELLSVIGPGTGSLSVPVTARQTTVTHSSGSSTTTTPASTASSDDFFRRAYETVFLPASRVRCDGGHTGSDAVCGFVGVVSRTRVPGALLDEMRDRLAHRGPDGAASWQTVTIAGHVAFGHRRLSIIDLSSAGDQPMHLADAGLTLVHNGEIYNYIELRDELAASGVRFRSHSDTEVLLQAYARWGPECLSRLNGMFAFAIWDAQRQELFLARDRFGEKPLFHTTFRTGFAFASEMKALFAHPDIRPEIDQNRLADYGNGRFYDDGYRDDVPRGDPPSAGTRDAGRSRWGRQEVWRYWTPDYERVDTEAHPDAAADRFRELLERSVRMRLRSDVPVGTSLSGGLDSSAIVGLVARVRGEGGVVTQNTFSGRFDDDPTLSEGPSIDAVYPVDGHRGSFRYAHGSGPDGRERTAALASGRALPLCVHLRAVVRDAPRRQP